MGRPWPPTVRSAPCRSRGSLRRWSRATHSCRRSPRSRFTCRSSTPSSTPSTPSSVACRLPRLAAEASGPIRPQARWEGRGPIRRPSWRRKLQLSLEAAVPRPWPRQPPRGASVAGRPSRARRLKSSKAGALRARQAGAWGISALCPQARPSSEDASRRRPSGSKAAVVGPEECALIRNGRRRAFGIPTMASFDPPECREESGNLFGGSRFFLVLLRAARCVFGQFGCRQVS
mmetsp:Transcript_75096/g.181509  ORF Transcript_75096/g.181509 Transcript_75096/m.181509 type:complete len:232 (+) Transcript_75096:687-1382(+)